MTIKCGIGHPCPKGFSTCCYMCNDMECTERCGSVGCASQVSMDEEMVAFESKYLTALKTLAEAEIQAQKAKAIKEKFTPVLMQAMAENGVKKFENEFITITYVEPHVTQKLDSSALKKMAPEVYESFVTASEVKGSIRISAKKGI